MIKIISGKYKGNNLASLSTKVVRPTQARIKKSLLEILGPYDNKSVLDLFSGIGTVGIEMLSRGAKSLTCVEKDRRVFKTLLENLKNTCYDDEVEVFCSDYKKYFNKQKMKKFDIIFADPPYYGFDYKEIFESSKLLLKEGGTFCMEMKKQDVDKFFIIKKYGNTQLIFWSNDE